MADRRKGPVLAPCEDEPRTAEEITELHGQLEYEMWMVKNTIDYLIRYSHRVGKPDLNACLESWLLHSRTLINFYFPPARGIIEDVIATDYVPTWNEEAELSDQLRQLRESANKALGRITYRTLDLPNKARLKAVYEEFVALRTRFEELLENQSCAEDEAGTEVGTGVEDSPATDE